MPTRNVVVTDAQSKMIDALVASGAYQNASEVLREGLRLIARREAAEAAKLRRLRGAVDEGLRSAAEGRARSFSSADQLVAEVEALWDEAMNGVSRIDAA